MLFLCSPRERGGGGGSGDWWLIGAGWPDQYLSDLIDRGGALLDP